MSKKWTLEDFIDHLDGENFFQDKIPSYVTSNIEATDPVYKTVTRILLTYVQQEAEKRKVKLVEKEKFNSEAYFYELIKWG